MSMSDARIAPNPSRLTDVLLWAAVAGLSFLTVLFSIRDAAPDIDGFSGADKIGHGVMYFAVLVPLLLAAVWRPGRGDGPLPNGLPWLALGLLAVGIGLEGVQAAFFPSRSAELLDIVAESLGIAAAVLVVLVARRASIRSVPGRRGTGGGSGRRG